jgi:hypothetical protein
MKPYQDRGEAEKRAQWARLTRVYPPTGEIVGETAWRRWRTADGWHPATPSEIVAEYGWLFEYGVPHA